ncbi:alanine dehydrogenase [Candidatus Woesearchaeota archaeon]|nr:alanine dehydrogenase [Candidatus Woesearchaeota archaeon]|tara:strand:+ start:6648 stop:7757 length:1110 start_codon:yes stop_codon:yes gene_type:complete
MIIGIIKEIKDKENRVALTPEGAKQLTDKGHKVLLENNAGIDSGFANEEYLNAGAEIVDTEKAWNAELIIKVKEPLEKEYKYLKNQIIFTYFHLSGVPKSLTEALLEKKTSAIAYETIEDENGKLPLLAPMSAVAGNMAVTMGSYYLAKFSGGSGMQLGTVLGKKYGKVMIIGDGIVGRHAAKTAYGMGAKVYVFGIEKENEEILKKEIGEDINWILSNKENISEHIKDADLVVGAVLLHGAKAPFVISEDMVKSMQPGSVIVDVSIDQGGCIQTSKPTSHSNPIFIKHDVIHYCVTNMPGAYPKTSTMALTEATLPYILKLAEHGIKALKEDKGFAKGLNTHNGFITYESVAKDLGMIDKFKDLNELM